MPQNEFYLKHFVVRQDKCAMKIGTDSMILGAFTQRLPEGRVLDIGSGCGILSLMMAQKSPAFIDAIETDEAAFSQTCENISNCTWHNRIVARHTSLQDYKPEQSALYDLIVCNPPYFAAHPYSTDQGRKIARTKETLTYDELNFHVSRLLKPEGLFYIILPYMVKDSFVKSAAEIGLRPVQELRIKSYPPADFIRAVLVLGFKETPFTVSELCIYDSPGKYSHDYIELTREYYALEL